MQGKLGRMESQRTLNFSKESDVSNLEDVVGEIENLVQQHSQREHEDVIEQKFEELSYKAQFALSPLDLNRNIQSNTFTSSGANSNKAGENLFVFNEESQFKKSKSGDDPAHYRGSSFGLETRLTADTSKVSQNSTIEVNH